MVGMVYWAVLEYPQAAFDPSKLFKGLFCFPCRHVEVAKYLLKCGANVRKYNFEICLYIIYKQIVYDHMTRRWAGSFMVRLSGVLFPAALSWDLGFRGRPIGPNRPIVSYNTYTQGFGVGIGDVSQPVNESL